MNWSSFCIALGYDCYMMNIIQQIVDPMPTIFLHIDLAKLLLYCYHCICYKTIAITVTVTIVVATTIETIILLCY